MPVVSPQTQDVLPGDYIMQMFQFLRKIQSSTKTPSRLGSCISPIPDEYPVLPFLVIAFSVGLKIQIPF